MSALAICLVAIVGFVLVALCFGLFMFTALCRRRPAGDGFAITRAYPPEDAERYRVRIASGLAYLKGRSKKAATIRSDDGLLLTGMYYPADAPSDRNVIFFHGYHGSGPNDFALFADYYFSRGYNVLLIDERTHGTSEGRYITFGVKECGDCVRWAEMLADYTGPDATIVLAGLSMGAATVLSALDKPLPPQVKAVVSDCGFSSPKDELEPGLKFMHIPLWTAYLGEFWCRVLAGFSFSSPGAISAVSHATIPVLIVHGEEDMFVPVSIGRKLVAACPTCSQSLFVKGANHAGSMLLDPEGYERTLDEFLGAVG